MVDPCRGDALWGTLLCGTAVWEAPEAHQMDACWARVEHPKPCLTLHLLSPDTKPQRFPKAQTQVLFGDTLGCSETFH